MAAPDCPARHGGRQEAGNRVLYYIGNHLRDTVEAMSYLRLLDSISFRAIGGAITALLFTILFGDRIILALYRRGSRDTKRSFDFAVTGTWA